MRALLWCSLGARLTVRIVAGRNARELAAECSEGSFELANQCMQMLELLDRKEEKDDEKVKEKEKPAAAVDVPARDARRGKKSLSFRNVPF